VVFSEYVTPAIAQRCKSLGAAAAIPKSRPQELLAFVRALGGA
jgi:hypothetical protein